MEGAWGVMRVHHQRSRYIYDMFHRRSAISRELYDYCLKEGYADVNLIAKWKKVYPLSVVVLQSRCPMTLGHDRDGKRFSRIAIQSGFEKLCCLRCIQPRDTNFGTACICRVPREKLDEGKLIECAHCGCRGCASGSG